MSLSDHQIERYSRQIVLPEIGGRGQEVLLGSAAAVLGVGEPACTAVSYLAGAGVGRIDLFPGRSESEEAARRVGQQALLLNPEIRVEVRSSPVESSPDGWSDGYDAVVCAGDSATLRLAAAAKASRRRLIVGGVLGATGWLWAGRGNEAGAPCAVCAEQEALRLAAVDSNTPLASAVAGAIGSLLSLATLKLLLGIGAEPRGWWHYDGSTASVTLRREVRDECPACGCRGTGQ